MSSLSSGDRPVEASGRLGAVPHSTGDKTTPGTHDLGVHATTQSISEPGWHQNRVHLSSGASARRGPAVQLTDLLGDLIEPGAVELSTLAADGVRVDPQYP